jgi:Pyridoxamine 5'-phosphate oxidase
MATKTTLPTIPITEPDGRAVRATRLSPELVWQAVSKASFAIIAYVTPSGAARSSGVVYATSERRLYVAVAPESWKAKHIATSGRVSVTVPVRRGGLLSLILPIPPATISFNGAAIVHPAGWLRNSSLASHLAALVPPERRDSASIVEVVPEGEFLTYGLGVSLMEMRTPAVAQARVPV